MVLYIFKGLLKQSAAAAITTEEEHATTRVCYLFTEKIDSSPNISQYFITDLSWALNSYPHMYRIFVPDYLIGTLNSICTKCYLIFRTYSL